jgi:hypothetical protein
VGGWGEEATETQRARRGRTEKRNWKRDSSRGMTGCECARCGDGSSDRRVERWLPGFLHSEPANGAGSPVGMTGGRKRRAQEEEFTVDSFQLTVSEKRDPRTEEKRREEKLWHSIVRTHPSQKPRRMGHPQVQMWGGVGAREKLQGERKKLALRSVKKSYFVGTKWPRRFSCQQASVDAVQKGFSLPQLVVFRLAVGMPRLTR